MIEILTVLILLGIICLVAAFVWLVVDILFTVCRLVFPTPPAR
jgi:uncharacterized membrane protein